MNNLFCPEPDLLSAFAWGQLDEDGIERVALHLEQCPDCLAAVQTLDETNDTLVSSLRGASQVEGAMSEACRRAVSRAATFMDRVDSEATTAGRVVARLGRIRDYELIDELGQGGMGTVYKALHVNLKRLVALKILPPEKMQDRRAVARFHREMEAVGKLVHPNIVLAHDAGEADGQHFLVMECVDGLDLAQIAERCQPLPVADACELVRQAALGLQHAHQHGLVHRDIKPSNLILSNNGQTKVLDMGLALLDAAQTADDQLTGECQLMGTTDYMAPEQAGDSHTVDIRADIYSLGCTIYKLLAGRAPFSGPQYTSTLKKLMAHATAPVEPLDEARSDVPRALSVIVERMTAKSPDDRFSSPQEVADALAPFTRGADLPALLDIAGQSDSCRGAALAAKRTASGCASALEPTLHNPAEEEVSAAATLADAAPQIIVRQPPRKRSGPPTWLVGAAVTFAAVLALFATIKLIVKDKEGKTRLVELPDDATEFEFEIGGKRFGHVTVPVDPKPEKPAPPAVPPPDTIDRRVAEHVLAMGGQMDVLRVNQIRVNQIGDLPAASFKVVGIFLSGSQLLHADHIAMISQLRHLRSLDVSRTPVANDELAKIGKLSTLRSLSIDGTNVTNEGLNSLEELDELISLSLRGIKVTPRGMQSIAKLTGLQAIYLDDTGINDEGLAPVQGLSRVGSLSLARSRISDAGLKCVSGLKDLESLNLMQTRISGAGIAHLTGLQRLDALNLDGTWVKDDDVKELPSIPALHEVNLRDTRLTDGAIEFLSQAKTLTQIDLDGTRITTAGRDRLGEALPQCNLNRKHQEATRAAAMMIFKYGGTVNYFKHEGEVPSGPFEIFRLGINNPVGPESNWGLIAKLSNLQFLDVSYNTNISDDGLCSIGALPRIRVAGNAGHERRRRAVKRSAARLHDCFQLPSGNAVDSHGCKFAPVDGARGFSIARS